MIINHRRKHTHTAIILLHLHWFWNKCKILNNNNNNNLPFTIRFVISFVVIHLIHQASSSSSSFKDEDKFDSHWNISIREFLNLLIKGKFLDWNKSFYIIMTMMMMNVVHSMANSEIFRIKDKQHIHNFFRQKNK